MLYLKKQDVMPFLRKRHKFFLFILALFQITALLLVSFFSPKVQMLWIEAGQPAPWTVQHDFVIRTVFLLISLALFLVLKNHFAQIEQQNLKRIAHKSLVTVQEIYPWTRYAVVGIVSVTFSVGYILLMIVKPIYELTQLLYTTGLPS